MGGRPAIQGQGNQRTNHVSTPLLSDPGTLAALATHARSSHRCAPGPQLLASRSDRQQICLDCGYSALNLGVQNGRPVHTRYRLP